MKFRITYTHIVYSLLIGIFVLVLTNFYTAKYSWRQGYEDGYNDMFIQADSILANQTKSDTTITKLNLVDRDTITYYISKKVAK